MKILGVDQSFTSTGWVVVQDGKMLNFGICNSNKDDNKHIRAFQIAERVHQLAKKFKPDIIRMEGLAFTMVGNATRDLAGLQYAITTYLLLRMKEQRYTPSGNVPIEIVSPKALKKFATESGNASKEQMFDALPDDVRVQIGTIKKTKGRYDATDAYWLTMFVGGVETV